MHVSCHGTQDLADPAAGGLALHDGILTVADVGRHRYIGAFAALAACQTATGGVHLADEAITLASALHHVGCRHVVGTLWSVDSAETTSLFRAVYAAMTVDGVPTSPRAPCTVPCADCGTIIAWNPGRGPRSPTPARNPGPEKLDPTLGLGRGLDLTRGRGLTRGVDDGSDSTGPRRAAALMPRLPPAPGSVPAAARRVTIIDPRRSSTRAEGNPGSGV
ncbi:CHAT domain-containing protein [Frankia sp. AiPs1]|uniref:CHAT domain-containing protein n=1 Tax=Frankia sp. AiPs1 TaxID=573493 RepID=UPI0020442DE0|nr:CHAT domain-containing protein [Frankia sp. AiPs1]MCM3921238.1 CHAT domain-containing protein [Frankia sp. AiPs1]